MIAGVWKRRLKRSVLGMTERFGYDIERHEDLSPPYRLVKRIRLGRDGLRDAATILGRPLQRVIDVGAHVGQTAVRIADANCCPRSVKGKSVRPVWRPLALHSVSPCRTSQISGARSICSRVSELAAA